MFEFPSQTQCAHLLNTQWKSQTFVQVDVSILWPYCAEFCEFMELDGLRRT